MVNDPCGSNLFTIKRDGVVGNSDKEKPTYLKKMGFYNGLCDEGGGYRITVDTKKLLERRTLFHDHEGLGFRPEMGSTFLVFGGIPLESILELSQPDS